jgi:hypothetical protein
MKKTFIALVAVCAAMFALPGVASAGTWHTGPLPLTFTATGGTSEWLTLNADHSVASKTHCTSNSATGAYSTTTTGTMTITFKGCTSSGLSCTTSGQTSGTIVFTPLTFHNVMIHANVPGILLTPNSETNVFAHYVCGGFINVTMEGNGLIGTITSACGTETSATELKFAATLTNTQQHTQITTTGTVYDLKKASGETVTLVNTSKLTLSKKSKVECT